MGKTDVPILKWLRFSPYDDNASIMLKCALAKNI